MVSSESESEDGNETPTPVKSKLRSVMKVQTFTKQLEIVPKKQRIKLRRAPSTKISTATPTATTKTVDSNPIKTETRGRQKSPILSDNNEVEEESEVESPIRRSPQLDEYSDDQLVAYSDGLWTVVDFRSTRPFRLTIFWNYLSESFICLLFEGHGQLVMFTYHTVHLHVSSMCHTPIVETVIKLYCAEGDYLMIVNYQTWCSQCIYRS